MGRTISDVQKRDEQTDKQTQKLNVFGRPGGGWNPSPTKLGTVIDDLEHVLSPPKRLVVWRIVSTLGGAENLGITRRRQLKTPYNPLSKSNEILAINASWNVVQTVQILWKSPRDKGVCIPHFDQI